MSEGKHTPGPWKAEIVPADRFGPEYFRRVVDGNGDTLCLHGVALSSGEEAEANARLIAAAPDLLVVLKALRDECSGTPRAWVLVGLLTDASEAIAKAEGRT